MRILRHVARQAQRELEQHDTVDQAGDAAPAGRREYLARAATQTRARVADARQRRNQRPNGHRDNLRERLPRDPTCGAVARRLIEEHLGTARAEEIADAKTVVSELVNNAFLHGEGRIELRLSSRRGRARIEVSDEGNDAVLQTRRGQRRHGLDIVEALSLAWGAREGSTRVWAELSAGVRDDELASLPATTCDSATPVRG